MEKDNKPKLMTREEFEKLEAEKGEGEEKRSMEIRLTYEQWQRLAKVQKMGKRFKNGGKMVFDFIKKAGETAGNNNLLSDDFKNEVSGRSDSPKRHKSSSKEDKDALDRMIGIR